MSYVHLKLIYIYLLIQLNRRDVRCSFSLLEIAPCALWTLLQEFSSWDILHYLLINVISGLHEQGIV